MHCPGRIQNLDWVCTPLLETILRHTIAYFHYVFVLTLLRLHNSLTEMFFVPGGLVLASDFRIKEPDMSVIVGVSVASCISTAFIVRLSLSHLPLPSLFHRYD